ncbi:hypothetical protein SAMN05444164_8189 [Bradyrhizobium erythrophlei]|uniref:Uncharacterized protein n=1 Tax=Bradyrhizobium erythrophlei TaxID=1437360 RepID=A0A1H5J0Z6_9BRAD|nr:hypothetical protein SAMN05444164_8189 [Bradyrhizobium erythrophlei]
MRKGIVAQSTMTGAITRAPAASTSHQVNPATTESEKPDSLMSVKPAKAMAELIIVVGAKEMIANFATPDGVANVWRPFDQRPISHVPAHAARRLPIPAAPTSRSDRSAMR